MHPRLYKNEVNTCNFDIKMYNTLSSLNSISFPFINMMPVSVPSSVIPIRFKKFPVDLANKSCVARASWKLLFTLDLGFPEIEFLKDTWRISIEGSLSCSSLVVSKI